MPEWELTANSSGSDWGDITNKPSILSDNQISWDEILEKPELFQGEGRPKVTEYSVDSLRYSVSNDSNYSWYKIGNLVFLRMYIQITANPTNAAYKISGNNIPSASSVMPLSLAWRDLKSSTFTQLGAEIENDKIYIYRYSGITKTLLSATYAKQGTMFWISGCYLTS